MEQRLNFPLFERLGTGYVYANLGYCLLGLLVQMVTGRAYSDVVQEWVLAPLGDFGCRIEFRLEYDFASTLMTKLAGPAFERISDTLVDALVAAGGPFGPGIAGALLIIASRSPKATRTALAVLSAILFVVAWLLVRGRVGRAWRAIRDGEIAVAINKERITRKKHDTGFYQKVVDYCLVAEGISLDDVDLVVRNCYVLPVEDLVEVELKDLVVVDLVYQVEVHLQMVAVDLVSRPTTAPMATTEMSGLETVDWVAVASPACADLPLQ